MSYKGELKCFRGYNYARDVVDGMSHDAEAVHKLQDLLFAQFPVLDCAVFFQFLAVDLQAVGA